MKSRRVPLTAFDHNTAILGRTGSGKSYAARGIVEHWLTAGRRVCIVDPTEVWHGLRSSDVPPIPIREPAPDLIRGQSPSRRSALPEPPIRSAEASTAPGDLPPSAIKLLAVLARGVRLTWGQTATLAGLKARGGSFNTARKALRQGGYIVEQDNGVAATGKGIAAAGGARPRPETISALCDWWRAALPTSPARIFDQLRRQDGKWIDKQRLAGFLGLMPTGGSWNSAIAVLRPKIANKPVRVSHMLTSYRR